jgi:signal transduction histidine kinase
MDNAHAKNQTPISQPITGKVLAVDDQRDALRLLQVLLVQNGFDPIPLGSGQALLDYLESDTADVIILDVMMPEMDGFEVCRRLKENPATREIPVLFVTARDNSADKVRGINAGAMDYVTKPYDALELVARVKSSIRIKRLQDDLVEKLSLQRNLNSMQQGMLAEHWERTLGQIASSLAHELNNPLTAALGTVQLLSMSPTVDPSVKARLQVVDDSLQRASEKLRGLLSIAQNTEFSTRAQLAQVLQDLMIILNFSATIHKIEVRSNFAADCWWSGVVNELSRALLYVLNNAVEAVADKPGAQITVGLESQGCRHLISVTDNGPGIPHPLANRVFEAFFTTKASGHHGLGLYLAKQVIEAGGGKIWVDRHSEVGGARFLIDLPAS